MKTFGLALALALGAAVWQAAPFGQSAQSEQVLAGIDGRGSERSECVRTDSDGLSGCGGDEFRPITIASIDGSD